MDSPPLDPTADEARRLLIEELSGARYQAAKPNWFDVASKAVADWFFSLRLPEGGAPPAIATVITILVVVGVIVAVIVIVGRPRRNVRSGVGAELFGARDERSAAEMRRAAEAAATSEDWAVAIEERYRALARRCAERTVVPVSPGTTANGFAARASVTFPAFADRLHAAAGSFDGVRYLGGRGSRTEYTSVVALDTEIDAATPASLPSLSALSGAIR